jgi:O-6-methylguanine DNA methyltransferase
MILGLYTPMGFEFSLKYEIDSFLHSIEFVPHNIQKIQNLEKNESNDKEATIKQTLLGFFDQYFSGTLISHDYYLEILNIFEGMKGKRSDFSQKVLKTVAQIQFGTLDSYLSIAEKLGSRAYRAIGTILATNRFPILIPCHRIVPNKSLAKIKDLIKANAIQSIDYTLTGGFMGEHKKESWRSTIKTSLVQFELRKKTDINNNV